MSLGAWFLILVLANNGLVELLHHGRIFKDIKLRLISISWLTGLNCPYCLSYRSSALLVLMTYRETHLGLLGITILALATARGSNLVNDYLAIYSRTPKA